MPATTSSAAGSAAALVDERAWQRFTAALGKDLESVGAEIIDREYEVLPSYEGYREGELTSVANEGVSGLLPLLSERRVLTNDELGRYWSTTEAQAVEGVTLDDMLQAWHIGLDVLRGWARRRVAADEMPAGVMVEFLEWTIPWMDEGSKVSIEYYRRREGGPRQDDEQARRSFVRRLLTGEISGAELTTRSGLFGLDIDRTYHAVRAPADDDSTARRVRSWLGLDDPGGGRTGLVARIGDEVWGFVSDLPSASIDIPVGVSGAVPLDRLPRAFALASRAMETAASMGLCGRHDIKSLGVHPAILEDHDVGDSLIERYVTPIEHLGGSGCDILNTVRVYLASQNHYERTATELYVHPNTVRYRLRKFEELTGASLRDTDSIAAVWWALERRRLLTRHA